MQWDYDDKPEQFEEFYLGGRGDPLPHIYILASTLLRAYTLAQTSRLDRFIKHIFANSKYFITARHFRKIQAFDLWTLID